MAKIYRKRNNTQQRKDNNKNFPFDFVGMDFIQPPCSNPSNVLFFLRHHLNKTKKRYGILYKLTTGSAAISRITMRINIYSTYKILHVDHGWVRDSRDDEHSSILSIYPACHCRVCVCASYFKHGHGRAYR